MRRARRLSYVLLGIVAVLGILVVVVKVYLASAQGAVRVAARLEEIYGAHVAVGEVDVGLGSSSLRDVRLYEAGANAFPEPWAVIADAQADVSAWSLFRGVTPRQLTLTGAVVTLRFDRDGHLLTRFPKREGKGGTEGLEDVHLVAGQVILRQEGKPDLTVASVAGHLRPEGDKLVLTGSGKEERWGSADLSGFIHVQTAESELTVKSVGLHFTQAMLDDLPFVSAKVWKALQAEGDAKGELTVRYLPETDRVHYRLDLDGSQIRLHVRPIDLHTEQTSGRILIEDRQVHLRDVKGTSAGGAITTSGDLDFGKSPDRLHFTVVVERLKLGELPKKWFQNPLVQRLFDGRLSGDAALTVTIKNEDVSTSGTGTGVVHEARVAGQPANDIRLRLNAEGKGFRITIPPPEANGDKPQGRNGPAKTCFAADLVNWAHAAVVQSGQTAIGIGTNAGSLVRKGRKKEAAPSTLEIDLALRDADLAELLRGLRADLPLAVRGRISFDVHVTMPLDTPGNLKAYRVRGKVDLAWLGLADLELEQLQAKIDYGNGILRLDDLTARVPGQSPRAGGPPLSGAMAGSARLQVVPAGELDTSLTLEHVPLAAALRLLPSSAAPLTGSFSGDVTFAAPLDRFQDTAAWRASGSVRGERSGVLGWEMTDYRAKLLLRAGRLTIADLDGRLAGARVNGAGEVLLIAPYRYEARAAWQATEPAALQELTRKLPAPLTIAGSFTVKADLQGTLRPLAGDISGSAEATGLRVAAWPIDAAQCRWTREGDRLRLTALRANALGGEATGEALLPLTPALPGDVLLRFRDVELSAAAKGLDAVAVPIAGKASGLLQCHFSAAGTDGQRDVTTEVALQASHLRIRGIPAERLSGSVTYRADRAAYSFTANTLGGQVHLENGQAAVQPPGRLRVERVQLARLWEALGIQDVLGSLRGGVSLDLAFRQEGQERLLYGKGRFALSRLRWGDVELGESVGGDLLLQGQELRVKDLSGSIGQGLLRGSILYNFAQPGRGRFSISLESVEAARLLAPWPALATRVEGTLDLRVRGSFGPEWRGSGDVSLARGTLFGADIVNWRLPFDVTFTPQEGRGQVEIREMTAQVALGQASGRASLGWGSGSRLEGSVRFHGVDLRTLLRSLADSSPVGAGQLSGRLDFAGSDVRALDDLTANLDASLQQAQALQLPVLQQLLPYLAPGQSSAPFQTGDLQARLARGVVRVQRLRLVGMILQVIIEGTIGLDGRVNLDATANTGGLAAALPGLRALNQQVTEGAAIPVGILGQATRLLSVRLIHLRVSGTVRNPSVQRDSLLTMTEEAVRFFLGFANRNP